MINHSTQVLRYHILRVNRINCSLQYSTNTRNRELNRLTQTTTELKFEVTVESIGLNPHPIPNSFLIKQRTFPSPFIVPTLQFTSIDEPALDHQWGSIAS